MSKFTGNIIRLPAVTPTQNSASGVYTLDDQFTAQSSGTWPIVRDQYFNYTTLLLTGAVQGTAYPNPVTQPYSFLSDASTNNFVVSPNGDVSARPFNPYLNNYSNYFSSASSYFTPPSSAIPTGAGTAFTIEAWVYPSASASTFTLIGIGSAGNFIDLYVNTNNQLVFDIKGTVNVVASPNNAITTNQWQHVVLTRTAGNLYTLYVNGTSVGTPAVNSTSLSSSSSYLLCAGNGYVSNLRVTTGAVVYSGSFTPPTSPLSATVAAGTVLLLTCQSNRFRDAGPSNLTLTVNGSPAVSQNSPFVSYDTTNGSGYFDGTGDYLFTPTNAAFAFGTGDISIEFWYYHTSRASTDTIFALPPVENINIYILTSGVLGYYNGSTSTNSSQTVPLNAWGHIAWVRASGTVKMYYNGVEVLSHSNTTNFTTNAQVYLGSNPGLTDPSNGYLADVRVLKGTAVYTGAFSPPVNLLRTSGAASAASYPSTTNVNTSFAESATSLLTLQTRAPATNNGFIDSSPNNFVVTRNGNTTQGSFSPFSPTGWSNYFDGDGDYLSVPVNSTYGLDTSNFTFECWYFASSLSAGNIVAWGSESTGYASVRLQLSSTGYDLLMSTGGSWAINTTITAYVPPIATWTHLAFIRSGTSVQLFQNGTLIFSGSLSGSLQQGSNNWIGKLPVGGSTNFAFNGYISNFRFIKGQALYSGATVGVNYFTPSTAPLTATAVGNTGSGAASSITGNVLLLTCQSNRFRDVGPASTAITVNGNPSVQAFSPFAPAQSYIPSQIGGSGYFDGTTDWLYTGTGLPSLGTSDFMIEMWIYPTTFASDTYPLFSTNNGAKANVIALEIQTTGILYWYVTGTTTWSITSASVGTLTLNQWSHIAFTRSGTSFKAYINGKYIQGAATSSQSVAAFNGFNIGQNGIPGGYFTGYMSSIRYVIGSAVYTGDFTPPTSPLTPVTGTSLLLNFTNGGIVDATGKNNLETVANSGVQTSIINPFGSRTGLMYFNGSSYFYEPYTQLMNQLNGNFTIECWIYPTVTNTRMLFAGSVNSTGVTNWYFEITSANKLRFEWDNTSTFFEAISSASIAQNTWTYVAVVRNGGTITQYINGSADGTASPTGTYKNASYPLSIGRAGDYNGLYFTGYIDEFRMAYVARTITASPTGPFPLG